jgi:hypothetical protein
LGVRLLPPLLVRDLRPWVAIAENVPPWSVRLEPSVVPGRKPVDVVDIYLDQRS